MTGEPQVLAPAAAYALWAESYPAHAHNPVMKAEERAMLSLMPSALQGRTVLDVGCGSGRYLLQALKRGATHLFGVDLSPQMLQRAEHELEPHRHVAQISLTHGDLRAIAAPDAQADLTICGLVIGHVADLRQGLSELHRVTRPGGMVLCSDVHPIGPALGWRRDFRFGDKRFAVQHTQHLYSHWHTACLELGLEIKNVVEPMLDPSDIPAGAHFDPVALQVPVALVFGLRRVGP